MTTLPLTVEYVRSIVEPAARGDWKLFIDAIDPGVHWIVADPVFNSTSLTGTYVRLLSEKYELWLTFVIESPRMARQAGWSTLRQIDRRRGQDED